jgi:hypothetical protein
MFGNWERAVSRGQVAAALVVGMCLLASTPASAGETWRDWGTIQLANTADEPSAAGEARLTNVQCRDADPYDPSPTRVVYCNGRLTVSCRSLTPGATYWTPAGTFTANRKGEGGASGKVSFTVVWCHDDWWGHVVVVPYDVDVIRLDPDGSGTAVLTGSFIPPWCWDPAAIQP